MKKTVFKGLNITVKDIDCSLRVAVNQKISLTDKGIKIKEQRFAICLN